ncbi:hypothetical protein Pan97_07900 [Bremerella volcania]|uniref:DUF4259 domain-containing protein n=1 Tax=Bremerella volcania TaxID=2527984 RepID=A0A518C3I4_9BACT|nr:NAD(P)H-dependent oxidoreductase [Bremerella volcania]QDU73790.1 hypothetical protein Pan97_07900 [Bremerella volcania]
MGSWGFGNFQNDAALDYVEGIADQVRSQLVHPDEIEDLLMLMAQVDMLRVLVEHCNARPPEEAELIALRDACLEIFDEEKEEFYSTPEDAAERRDIIAKTFCRFLKVRKDWD